MIMHSLLMTLEKRKSILLQNYPSNEELTKDFFDRISDMLLTDFDSISRNLSRTKIVFNCISTIIETAFSSNIQKQYLLDIINIFDDSDVARYLKKSYKIEKCGKFRLKIQVVSINSMYHQAIAFSLSTSPKFDGKLLINGEPFIPEKKQLNYVMPVSFPDKIEILLDLDIAEGYFRIANASDFLDDYPELIKQISMQTGRSREQFRGNSYASGFSAGHLYGNAFWVEQLSANQYRFHCNDHKMDDDFDDLVFDLKIEAC